MEYIGSKFRPVEGEFTSYLDNNTNERIYKQKFVPTRAYMIYLQQKQQEEMYAEIVSIKRRLDYQMKKYGEVDEIDVQLLQAKMKEYYRA